MFTASIYLIFVIAALELRLSVLNSSAAAIEGLAVAFREPPSGNFLSNFVFEYVAKYFIDEWETVINRVLIPRLRILQLYAVPTLFADQLLYLPSANGPVFIRCSDLEETDKVFSQIKMK